MTSKSRFIASVRNTAKTTPPQMPWARGTRRADWIAKRKQPTLTLKSA